MLMGKIPKSQQAVDGVGTIPHGLLNDMILGIQERIGSSESNETILDQMETEHLRFKNVEFISGNYSIHTTSEREWLLVAEGKLEHFQPPVTQDVDARRRVPAEWWTDARQTGYLHSDVTDDKERSRRVVAQLAAENDLSVEEVIAIILYTGPMYVVYNAILERFPPQIFDLFHGGFKTTILVVDSALRKLSQKKFLSILYRGTGGRHRIPDQFWQGDGFVLPGFTSTSSNKIESLKYSGAMHHDRPHYAVFRFVAKDGKSIPAAGVKALSQFPHEQEYTVPPLSFVEPTVPIQVDIVMFEGKEVPVISATITASVQTLPSASALVTLTYLGSSLLKHATNSSTESHMWERIERHSDFVREIKKNRAPQQLLKLWAHADASTSNARIAASYASAWNFISKALLPLNHNLLVAARRPLASREDDRPSQKHKLVARSSLTTLLLLRMLAHGESTTVRELQERVARRVHTRGTIVVSNIT
jgi:hypothetical protein